MSLSFYIVMIDIVIVNIVTIITITVIISIIVIIGFVKIVVCYIFIIIIIDGVIFIDFIRLSFIIWSLIFCFCLVLVNAFCVIWIELWFKNFIIFVYNGIIGV